MKNKELSNIFAYLRGYSRYYLYYSKYFKWLIPNHIYEQITWRINVMDKECYNQGYCSLCYCDTTALQMANKACDKPCYPKMMNKKEWSKFKNEGYAIRKLDK